jgi:hypothetical protein
MAILPSDFTRQANGREDEGAFLAVIGAAGSVKFYRFREHVDDAVSVC